MLRMREWLEGTLAKHSNKEASQVFNDIERDLFLTAEPPTTPAVDQVLSSRKNAS